MELIKPDENSLTKFEPFYQITPKQLKDINEAYRKEKVNEDLADDLIHNLRKMSYSEDYIQGVLNAKRILLM